MNAHFQLLMCLGLTVVLFFGCSTFNPKDAQDLNSILEAYKTQNKEIKKKSEKAHLQGIKELTIAPSGNDFLVTADLENASLSPVIHKILDETHVPYLFEDPTLSGSSSARFKDLPLLKAVNFLIEPYGISASAVKGILIFKNQISENNNPSSSSPPKTVSAEVPINHLDVSAVSVLLGELFPKNPGTGTRVVNFAKLPASNKIYLSGPESSVERAIKLLRKMDRKPSHVNIEALVVEFNSDALEKIGSDIQNAADGAFSAFSTNFLSATGNSILFTRTAGQQNDTVFTGIVNLLISQNKARLVSRPYLSTLSGKKAEINITRDRYVMVQESVNGAAITAPVPISSGVSMSITPYVRSDGKIRLDIKVEDSAFIETASTSVAVEVDKNKAETSMLVNSGQSIIIGGLTLNNQTSTDSGMPWLRHVPLLNFFAAKKDKSLERTEVMIYLTPKIWEPGLTPPLDKPKALAVPKKGGELFGIEKLAP